jgi:hypothetical protein
MTFFLRAETPYRSRLEASVQMVRSSFGLKVRREKAEVKHFVARSAVKLATENYLALCDQGQKCGM